MRILIDTNVILDYIADRKPFSDDSIKIIEKCIRGDIQACIAAHTISNLFYILRKDVSLEKRREILQKLCKMFKVIGIDSEKLIYSLDNKDFEDFEDCIQMECAKEFESDFIITRNIKDYQYSTVKAVEPKKFIEDFKL